MFSGKNFAILAIFSNLVFSNAHAIEGQSVVIRTQWNREHFSNPIVTLLGKDSNGIYSQGGSGPLNDYKSSDGCSDILSKLFEFPLQKMLDLNYITEEAFEFYRKLGPNLDPRQVIYLNMAETTTQHFEKGKSVLPNLLQLFDTNTAPIYTQMQSATKEWLNVKSSMWVVRGQIPSATAEKFLTSKVLPWELEKPLQKYMSKAPHSEMRWEFGRAARESEADYLNMLKIGTHVAAKDALAAGVALSDARIFIHTLNDKVSNHLKNHFGFVEFALSPQGDHLSSVTVEDLMSKVGSPDFFYNLSKLKKNYPNLSAADLTRVEERVTRNSIYYMDDLKLSPEEEGIILYNGNQGPYVHQDLKKIDSRLSIEGIRDMRFQYDKMLNGSTDHANQLIMRTNTDWGIGNLSESQLKKEPTYLERVIYEVNAYGRDLNRKLTPDNPWKSDSPRNFFMATSSESIVSQAKKMGATVERGQMAGHATYNMTPGVSAEYHPKIQTVYTIQFSAEKVKVIARDYGMSASGKTIRRGYHQLLFDQLNTF